MKHLAAAAAAVKSLQSCPILCNPIEGNTPGSAIPGILQARTLEWVAISFSKAWKWKVTVKSLSGVRLFATPWTAAYQVDGIFQARVLEWGTIAFSMKHPGHSLNLERFNKGNNLSSFTLETSWGFPGGSSGKEPTCQYRKSKRCGFSPWVEKIPWRKKWQPTPAFLPGKSHGQRSLADYSP